MRDKPLVAVNNNNMITDKDVRQGIHRAINNHGIFMSLLSGIEEDSDPSAEPPVRLPRYENGEWDEDEAKVEEQGNDFPFQQDI